MAMIPDTRYQRPIDTDTRYWYWKWRHRCALFEHQQCSEACMPVRPMVWQSSCAPVGTKQADCGRFTTSGSASVVAGSIASCHSGARGTGSPGQEGQLTPLKFEIGVKKLIPHLCRTGDFWPWPPCWKMVPARLSGADMCRTVRSGKAASSSKRSTVDEWRTLAWT